MLLFPTVKRSKYEMCPICKVVALKPVYYKKMMGGVLQWFGKDVMVCPTEICTVILTHTNNRVLYLAPHPGKKPKPAFGNVVSTHVLAHPL